MRRTPKSRDQIRVEISTKSENHRQVLGDQGRFPDLTLDCGRKQGVNHQVGYQRLGTCGLIGMAIWRDNDPTYER
eukprot:9244254-Pyramimonas_sp.AAC.1